MVDIGKLTPAQLQEITDSQLILWSLQNMVRLKERQSLNFTRYPFLADIYKDTHPNQTIRKSAQLGLTTYAAAFSMWRTSQGYTSAIYFPHLRLMEGFVKGSFNTYLRLNPSLSALVGDTDSANIKRIGRGVIHFKLLSASSETDNFGARSVDLDSLILDEADTMLPEKMSEVTDRLEGSDNPTIKYISTPGFPGTGIDRLFLQGDQQYWLLKCPHCAKWNCIEDLIAEQKKFPDIIEQGFLSCGYCNLELDLLKGQWVAKKPGIESARSRSLCRLYDTDGKKNNLYVRLLHDFKTTRSIRKFYNGKLGLPYADSSLRLTVEEILSLCDKDRPIYSQSIEPCTMGVDVGDKKGINYVVSRPGKTRLREIINLGVVNDLNDLDRIIISCNVNRFVIDGKYERTAVKAFVQKWKRLDGWYCDYSVQKSDYRWSDNKSDPLVSVNRTDSMDQSQYLLRNGMVSLPDSSNTEVRVFATHCSNVAKNTEVNEKTGLPDINYIRLGPDDYRHAFNYDCIGWYEGERINKFDPNKTGLNFTAQSFYSKPMLHSGKLQNAVLKGNYGAGSSFRRSR